MRFDDLGDVESWVKGAPEVRIHALALGSTIPYSMMEVFKTEFEPSKRRDINGKWWACPAVAMHLWEFTTTGTKFTYGFYEYDPAGNTEQLIGIQSATITLLDSLRMINGTWRAVARAAIDVQRSISKANNNSDYIGTDDVSIFNDSDEYHHGTGGFKYRTKPDQ
jgi:hypothetical protein